MALWTKANVAGLTTLALLTSLPIPWVASTGPAVTIWVVGYVALASLAVFAWRSERWPPGHRAALKLAGAAALAGTLAFSLSALVVSLRHPDLGFLRAGLAAGPGLALAIALCPCLTSIALAGAVHNAIAKHAPGQDCGENRNAPI